MTLRPRPFIFNPGDQVGLVKFRVLYYPHQIKFENPTTVHTHCERLAMRTTSEIKDNRIILNHRFAYTMHFARKF